MKIGIQLTLTVEEDIDPEELREAMEEHSILEPNEADPTPTITIKEIQEYYTKLAEDDWSDITSEFEFTTDQIKVTEIREAGVKMQGQSSFGKKP